MSGKSNINLPPPENENKASVATHFILVVTIRPFVVVAGLPLVADVFSDSSQLQGTSCSLLSNLIPATPTCQSSSPTLESPQLTDLIPRVEAFLTKRGEKNLAQSGVGVPGSSTAHAGGNEFTNAEIDQIFAQDARDGHRTPVNGSGPPPVSSLPPRPPQARTR